MTSSGNVIGAVIGKTIWHVGYGGAAGATFSLSVGGKAARQAPLRNSDDPEFQKFSGEVTIYGWGSWTLRSGSVFSSSDIEDPLAQLDALNGRQVSSLSITAEGSLRIGAGDIEVFVTTTSEVEDAWEVVTPLGELIMTATGQLIEVPP